MLFALLNFTKMQQSNFKAYVWENTNKIHHIINFKMEIVFFI